MGLWDNPITQLTCQEFDYLMNLYNITEGNRKHAKKLLFETFSIDMPELEISTRWRTALKPLTPDQKDIIRALKWPTGRSIGKAQRLFDKMQGPISNYRVKEIWGILPPSNSKKRYVLETEFRELHEKYCGELELMAKHGGYKNLQSIATRCEGLGLEYTWPPNKNHTYPHLPLPNFSNITRNDPTTIEQKLERLGLV